MVVSQPLVGVAQQKRRLLVKYEKIIGGWFFVVRRSRRLPGGIRGFV